MAPPTPTALRGIRIADVTIITAGAGATQVLADLGADVVKIESASYPDPFRHWDPNAEAEVDDAGEVQPAWDASPTFNAVNRNKRGITLDLKHPLGREAFLRLVAMSDVVTENFRRGVMDRLGLSYAALQRVKPDVVMVSLCSQGASGPESGYASFGSTLDALSGLMSISGYGPQAPSWSGNEVNYPDQVVSLFGASAVLLGLRQRDRTGRGVHIELSQRELVSSMMGEVVLDAAVNGTVRGPQANRDTSMVPHGVYRCGGDDAWLAIAVDTDQRWRALCVAIGRPALADDARLATQLGRWQHQAEVDAVVGEWTASQDKRSAMTILQAAGVQAGAVLNGRDLLEDPHLAQREFYQPVVHPVGGLQRQRSTPFHLSRTPARVYAPAPRLGQHTTEVLRSLLGYSDAEIAHLEAEGVTGSVPHPRRQQVKA